MPWTFLTNHPQVLLALAAEPRLTTWAIAAEARKAISYGEDTVPVRQKLCDQGFGDRFFQACDLFSVHAPSG